MSGYAARDEPSKGTEQDLHAKVVALEDREGNRVVLGSLELLFVPDSVDDAVVEHCRDVHGLGPGDVLLGATHTHCGPVTRNVALERYGVATEERLEQTAAYRERLEETLVDLVDEAMASLELAAVRYTRGRCAIAMNRPLPTENGTYFRQYPEGPVDYGVPVLAVEAPGSDPDTAADEETELRAVVFGYACHPTSLYQFEYSGDWAGYAMEYLEDRYPEATAVFVQGCGGDQKAYPQRASKWAKRHGRTLASAVEAVLDARRHPVSGPLRTAREEQSLSFEAPPSRDELETMVESDDQTERVHARMLLDELAETGNISTEYSYPVQTIGFGGDLTLVALQGEVLVEYALKIDDAFTTATWVSAYSNGALTYVPTAQALAEGGYEAGHIAKYGYAEKFKPDVEDRILRKVRALGERVGATARRDV